MQAWYEGPLEREVFDGGFAPPPRGFLARLADAHLSIRAGRVQGLGPGAVVEVFASEETGTWTITVTSVNGTTCLVASGNSYTSVAAEPEGEPL